MNTRRIIGIVVAVALLMALMLLFTDPWSMLRRESGKIVLRDPSSVDGILVWSNVDSVRLTRTGTGWYLKGGMQVSPRSVENLLFAASRLSISSSVPAALLPAEAGRRHVRFRQGDRLLLAYTFLSADGKYLVRPEGSDLAYYVTLPGYAGLDLDRVFSDRTGHYLEKVLIDLVPSEIALIRVERSGSEPFAFRQDTLGGITCYRRGSQSPVPVPDLAADPVPVPVPDPAPDPAPVPATLLDTLSIRLLFSYFTSIRYERRSGIPVEHLTGPEGEAMIARLTVRSNGGEEHTLRIFPFREKPGMEPHMFLALVAFDDESEALVVNYIYLDVLMRDLSHYFGSGE